MIAGYVAAMREIQRQFDLAGDIDVSSVARLPGARRLRDGLDAVNMSGLDRALDEALETLELMRKARRCPGRRTRRVARSK
jgi:hypothetical protein